MTEPRPIYTIRVVYKSGYVHDFEAYSFSFTGHSYKWEPVGPNKPIELGATEVAAVWQLSYRFE